MPKKTETPETASRPLGPKDLDRVVAGGPGNSLQVPTRHQGGTAGKDGNDAFLWYDVRRTPGS